MAKVPDYTEHTVGTPKGASQIVDRYKEGLKAIRTEQHNYWVNHAFLLGEQWLYFDSARNTLAQLPRDPDRVQVTVNKIWPASRSIIAKHTSRPMSYEVPPSAADDATIRAARIAESIPRSLALPHDWEGMREDAGWAAWKGGTAALVLDWDPEAGQPLGLDEHGKNFGTGDTVEAALTIVDFVVEPGVRDARKARWWIRCQALPPEDVKDRYGLSSVPKPDASAALTPFQAKLLSEHYQSGSDATDINLTRVLTYYERPNKSNPAGCVKVVVGEEVVDESAWPFPFKDELNIEIIRETRINGRWTGATVMTIARPVQTAINQSWSSIIEHMKLAGNARMRMSASAVDMIDEMTDTPGEAVVYPDGATPPDWMTPPQMPQWWLEQPQVLGAELDDILGHHDVSKGSAPANIESGLGLSILVEQDSTPLGRLTKESALAFGRFISKILRTYEAKVSETRTSVVKAGGQAPETSRWTGKDLMGQTECVIPMDSVMPRDKASQQARADLFVQMGMISTIEQYIKVTESPMDAGVLQSISPDVDKARRENYMMANGRAIPPAVFDDHVKHNGEHLTFMKSPAWDDLTPEAQNIFLTHVQGHATMSGEQLGNLQAKAQVSPLLATAARTDSAPVIPPEALAGAVPALDAAPPVEGPVSSEAADLAAVMSEQHPDIDPAVIQAEL